MEDTEYKLAQAVRQLLLDSQMFRVDQWASVLSVETSAIEGWLWGEVPASEPLNMAMDAVRTNSNANIVGVEAIEALRSERMCDIADTGVVTTLDVHLMEPLVTAFRDILRTVPVEHRMKALQEAGDVCRKYRAKESPSS